MGSKTEILYAFLAATVTLKEGATGKAPLCDFFCTPVYSRIDTLRSAASLLLKHS